MSPEFNHDEYGNASRRLQDGANSVDEPNAIDSKHGGLCCHEFIELDVTTYDEKMFVLNSLKTLHLSDIDLQLSAY
jgi:hypothetical protein